MSNQEQQQEANRLRTEWLTLLGHTQEVIEHSLRYDRPTSIIEEQHQLELAMAIVEAERALPW